MTTKPWYQSKLFWTGVILILTSVLTIVSQATVTVQDVVVAVLGGLVSALRVWFTDTAIDSKAARQLQAKQPEGDKYVA